MMATVICFYTRSAIAQAPNIGYPKSSYALPLGSVFNPIAPTNTGGAVSNGLVSTLAGIGPAGNGATGIASFNFPADVAIDAIGNVYVADQNNNVIRKISPSLVVSTFAGNTQSGSTNGTGKAARFNQPTGIAVDAAGNVYVADFGNNKIRKITKSGVVTTLAGNGSRGSDDGSGGLVTFNQPSGVAVDTAGNVYVADFGGNKIRKITPSGVTSTIAGTGSVGTTNGAGNVAKFDSPFDVAVDLAGNVYVTDQENHRIRKINKSGVVSTLAGGSKGDANGTGTAAKFFRPAGITIDASGNLYVADQINQKIRRVTSAGVVTTLAGSGTQGAIDGNAGVASFNGPSGVAVDPATGNIYVADINNNSIRFVDIASGIVSTLAGVSGKGNADGSGAATFNYPNSTVVDANGNVFVSDKANNTIRKVTTAGNVTTFATGLNSPSGLAIDNAGNLFVSTEGNHSIYKVSTSGTVQFVAGGGGAGANGSGADDGVGASASFNVPSGLAIDPQGNVYVADKFNNKIRKVTPAGVVSSFAGSGLIGIDDGFGALASFYNPTGIVIDTAGNFFVADQFNNLIRKVSPAAEVTTIAGDGSNGTLDGAALSASFYRPYDINVDIYGNLYVSDQNNNKIRKISTSGVVTTLAGGGGSGFYGGGCGNGVGLLASFKYPAGITLHPSGIFYLADNGNHLIRKITLGYTISPSLPKGLSFDFTTGIISGTPTELSPATNYTITGINEAGSSVTTVSIAVVAPLPVNLIAFKALALNKTIATEWQTASEINTTQFVLQRSATGTEDFTTIGIIKAVGKGANRYQFMDNEPIRGINFYRLKIVDKDGSISYSNIVSAKLSSTKADITIFPNPAKDFTTIRFAQPIEKGTIVVTDLAGKTLLSQIINRLTYTFQLNTQSLQKGVYLCTVTTETGKYCSQLFVNP